MTFMFVGTLYKVTQVEATTYWWGYIRDLNTNQPIYGAKCTLKFYLYGYPPTYEWGNYDYTDSNGYYCIPDDLPEDWGATYLKVEADGYVTKTPEIPADENYLGGQFDVYMRPYF